MTDLRRTWTPERDALLAAMLAAGLSTSVMCKELDVSEAALHTRKTRIGAGVAKMEWQFKEAIAEKAVEGWRHSRIARQYGIPEPLIGLIIEMVERRPSQDDSDLEEPPSKFKPRPAWTTRPPKENTMTKNRLSDLNDHLFAQLERLADEDLSADEIEKEAARASAIVDVADKIIQNASLGIAAAKLVAGHNADPTPYLRMIEGQVAKPAQVENRS